MFKRYEKVEGFTTLKGSDGLFSINTEGQIKDISGSNIKYTYDSEGYAIVNCLGWNGKQTYRVADLMAIQFKQLHIPSENYKDIEAFHIDDNKSYLHASNIGYRFKCGKIEYVGSPGYYYVPGLTFIAINEQGSIYNTYSHKHIVTGKQIGRAHV